MHPKEQAMTTLSNYGTDGMASRDAVPGIRSRRIAGPVALLLSLLACYGTLAAVAVLAALGVTLAVNPGVWAGAIVFFAALATVIVGFGVRRHRSVVPLVPALAGTALLTYVMFVSFDRTLELTAFVLLAGAVYWDYRLRARDTQPR
jgi:arsenite methyltransferase